MTRTYLRLLVRNACFAVLCFSIQSAWAHQRSESFSRWQYEGQRLSVLFTISESEAQRYFSPDGQQSLQRQLATYLVDRVGPSEDSACERVDVFSPTTASAGYLQFVAAWTCPKSPAAIDIGSFFELESEHSHLINVDFDDGFAQRLLDVDQHTWVFRDSKSRDVSSGENTFVSFAEHGARHIFAGPDHIVFLLALLLVCWRGREMLWAITGFTVGHSCSLALAVLGIVQPEIRAIEAAIGLTIVLVIVERASNAMVNPRRVAMITSILLLAFLLPAVIGASDWPVLLLAGMALFSYCYLVLAHALNRQAIFRLSITALFGLIHGFGFAGAFLAIELPKNQLALTLLGFNIGVELGQMLVLALLLLIAQARRLMPAAENLVREMLAATVGGLGTFWFASRLFA
jgi:hypothetical protein